VSFTNLQQLPDDLPRVSSLDLEPMAPAYHREVLTQQVITWGVLLLVGVVPFLIVVKPVALKQGLLYVPLGIAALALIIAPIVYRQARALALAVREHDLCFRKGLVWRKTAVLPFNRVQHIELSIGPLQRRFGLASLKFFTAGGAGADLTVDGLSRERAESLREYILARTRTGGARGTGLE